MRRVLLILAAVIVVLIALSQVILPRVVNSRIEDRLTRGGGSADVSVAAVPAVRLLFYEGKHIRVRGRDLDVTLGEGGRNLSDLDGFDEVDVRLSNSRVGPLVMSDFGLQRHNGGPNYQVTLVATASGADLSAYIAGRLGGPLGALFGGTAARAIPDSGRRIPIDAQLVLRTENGSTKVVSGTADVAGIPLGPLAVVVTNTVVSRL
jgi:hypothetical protein